MTSLLRYHPCRKTVPTCERMLSGSDQRSYTYFGEVMARYVEWCRQRIEECQRPDGADPVDVALAVEHALFNDQPKEHYLVVPNKFEGDIVIWKLLEELLWLNKDHKYSLSREEIIELLDRESGVINDGKPRTFPGPVPD